MARFKPVDYDQNLLLNVSLAKQLVPGSIEWAIHHLIEDGRIDLKPFHQRYQNDEHGRPAYDPRLLLKVVLVCYARGVLSSRQMERMCDENIVLMALTCGVTPDHTTLATFVSSMGDLAATVFENVLLICEQEGLLAGTHLSIDGTKLSSNASKEWSGTRKDLERKRDKIRQRIKAVITEHQTADRRDQDSDAEAAQLDRLRASADRIDAFLAESEPRIGRTGKEIQSNITDPESAKMATSHGVLQGYNANAVVDDANQVIVAAEVFGQGTDHGTLPSLLKQTEDHFRKSGMCPTLANIVLTADTSYFDQENLAACEAVQVDAYIPDSKFRQRDPQLHDQHRHRRPTLLNPKKPPPDHHQPEHFQPKDFTHEPEHHRLRCPAGKYLYSDGSGSIQNGRRTHRFKAPLSACEDCPLRQECLRKPGQTKVRQVTIFGEAVKASQVKNPTLAHRMRDKIDTLLGRKTYAQRLGNVEPVFATICTHKGMRRFTLRSKVKVQAQWLLYTTVHNISKIARFGRMTPA